MFARIVTLHGAPGRTVSPELTEKGAALAQKQPGFKAVYVLTDRNAGEFLSISFWETEQQARALDQSGARLRAEGDAALGATTPATARVYEVISQA
jgi:heme-degrading monooxygenase HmoA